MSIHDEIMKRIERIGLELKTPRLNNRKKLERLQKQYKLMLKRVK